MLTLRLPWPKPRVLDTAAMARRLLIVDEVPNNRLGTLATHFRTITRPMHRALDDARATVEVLHALIGRLGSHKVFTLEETVEFVRAISPAQRRKRHLAEGLPDAPGVYIFRDVQGPPALRWDQQLDRDPGAELLHCRREAQAHLGDDPHSRAGGGDRMRPFAGGRSP